MTFAIQTRGTQSKGGVPPPMDFSKGVPSSLSELVDAHPKMRERALQTSRSEGTLTLVAGGYPGFSTEDSKIAMNRLEELVERLETPNALNLLAKRSDKPEIRKTAIEMLADLSLLYDVIQYSHYSDARVAATKRFINIWGELPEADLLQHRIQLGIIGETTDMEVQRAGIEHLGEIYQRINSSGLPQVELILEKILYALHDEGTVRILAKILAPRTGELTFVQLLELVDKYTEDAHIKMVARGRITILRRESAEFCKQFLMEQPE